MAFDGLMTRAIARELDDAITGGRVDKIYMPGSDELVFHIRSQSGKYCLYATSGSDHARVHLTENSIDNPERPSALCMLLRKHLAGARISSVAQTGCERIIEIGFEATDELGLRSGKRLIFEIMGRHSNIVLVDNSTERIIDCIKRVSIDVDRVRQLLPGMTYAYPPDQGKIPFDTVTEEDIRRACEAPTRSVSSALLSAIQGISPAVADTLAQAGGAAGPEGPGYAKGVSARLAEMRAAAEHPSRCFVYISPDGTAADYHVFPLSLGDVLSAREFDSPSRACEFYYDSRTASNRARQKTADLERAVKNCLDKLYLKKQRISEDILRAQNSDDLRLYGELLTASLHDIKPGAASARVLNYYDGTYVDIPLDARYSPSKNAQHYFKKYGKARTAVKQKTVQLAETEEDIEYLESMETLVKNSRTAEEADTLREELIEGGYIRRRKNSYATAKKKPSPRRYTTSDGFTVLAGKNNTENDMITFKTASPKDIWFHAKDMPGSHVILVTEGREPSEKALFETAAIAAYYSKGRDSENVPVDYVPVRYVKKPGGAKPGKVIFTNNRTLYVDPSVPE